MAKLITTPNIGDHDGFYAELLETHTDLEVEVTHALNARLVLILANHIGDNQVLSEALGTARAAIKDRTD